MSDFAHVEDALIRSVLLGDVSEDALCYALHQTELAYAQDTRNDMIPFEVLTAREEAKALAAAGFEWREEDGYKQYYMEFAPNVEH